MRSLYAQVEPLVDGDLPVLILGETGVGKELLARILHLSSPRGSGPFEALNCAAIPAELLEAELFGIAERAATGVAGRQGTFQRAAGGTLFLDEIGEMPSELQAKLLRVLQQREIQPLGSRPVAVDVRVVAATNADLHALMDAGTFRRDLYFRIAGFVLEVPPLRERREDIPLLTERFLQQCCQQIGKPVLGLTVRVLEALLEYDWPGNVRELEHEVQRLVYLCAPGHAIESRLLKDDRISGGRRRWTPKTPGRAAEGSTPSAERGSALDARSDLSLDLLEQEAVRLALRRSGGNQVQAARLLGISRHGLRRRMERHAIAVSQLVAVGS